MNNIVIPDSLPKHPKHPFYWATEFFNENTMKSVHCFLHAPVIKGGYGYPIKAHKHEFYEINLVTAGEGIHYINNEKINIQAGDLFIIPPDVEHGYFEISDLHIFHALLGPRFFSTYKPSLQMMKGYDSLFNIEPLLRSNKNHNSYLQLSKAQFEEVYQDLHNIMHYNEEDVYDYNVQAAIVFQLICKFCKSYCSTTLFPRQISQPIHSYVPIVIYAMEFIKKNIANKLTIDIIAKELSVSPATFKRYFTEIAKIPPMEYIIKLRLRQAKKMLANTDKSITFIAYECGFFDSSHFVRLFKKSENISPSEYRKQVKVSQ